MASYTANYNLRKDASTDNYDVVVVNQNLDEIDEQMHQNEVASTTPFTGASSSDNGEKGIVPRPMAGDEDKVLCGDGTWKTPQSGASSVSTLTDVDLESLSDGQILKYNGTSQKWKNANESGGGDITDLDFSDMTGSQTIDVMNKLNSGVADSDSGTFTTGNAQYVKVEVNCGFRPTYIQVILPFSNGDTYATYDADVSTTTSTWEIPMEHNTYTITLGSETGETGITDITNTGFKFRCNAANTRNVQCTYSASISGQTYIQTVDFSDLSASQIATLKSILGITS